MYVSQNEGLSFWNGYKIASPTSVSGLMPRAEPTNGVSETSQNPQPLFNPDDNGSMILGITFFGVVPVAAALAFIVVQIHNLRYGKHMKRSRTTIRNQGREASLDSFSGLQGKPELPVESARHELRVMDLRPEMAAGIDRKYRMYGPHVICTEHESAIPELPAETEQQRKWSPEWRQELIGDGPSQELGSPERAR